MVLPFRKLQLETTEEIMTVLPLILTETAKSIYLWLHEIAHDDMARQASGWITDESRVANKTRSEQPITLDFDIPKKHRLNWIQRTIHQLPH
jgi:hypothetical protein